MSDIAPTGAPRVDILREPVGLPTETVNGLRLWVLANQLPAGHGWPLRIDWPSAGITYWPANLPAGDPPYTQTLMQVPRGPLWRALAAAGALWCADPAHDSPGPRLPCPHRLDPAGEHRPDQIADQVVELALTVALEQAGRTCEHPDPGGPIYQPVRGCPACGAQAVMKLTRGPDPVEQATRERLARLVGMLGPLAEAGHWVVGHGYVPAGDPRAVEWWRPAT